MVLKIPAAIDQITDRSYAKYTESEKIGRL